MERKDRVFFASFPSPIGAIFIASTEKGISDVCTGSDKGSFLKRMERKYGVLPEFRPERFESALRLLEMYFSGKNVRFGFPLDLKGTLFEKRVWDAIRKIPLGQVRSYKEIAVSMGLARGARAVGNACGKNPAPIIIPCHRVIRSNGDPGGYTGGKNIKEKLLALERPLTSSALGETFL